MFEPGTKQYYVCEFHFYTPINTKNKISNDGWKTIHFY